MMNLFKPVYILQFVLLVLIQVLVLDHIMFLGYINPYIYILLIIFLPVNTNRAYTLIFGFILGLCIDIFNDSGGVHAAASLSIAYLRPLILRLSFGLSYDYKTINLSSADFTKQFSYLFLMVFIHHLFMFSLEYFSINYWIEILKNTLFSGIFSLITIFIILKLIKTQ